MAVIRVEKNGNYTTMCNIPLREKNLSLKAKGLLAMCLSLPDDWGYSVNGLAAISKEGKSGILTALRELEDAGYVTRNQTRLPNGRLGTSEYVIREQKISPMTDKPLAEKPSTVNLSADNSSTDISLTECEALLSTDKQNKEYTNNRITKDVRHKYGQYGNVLLSDEELGKLQSEFPYEHEERIERLSEYMASTGKSYKNHLATIRNWAKRENPKKQSYSPSMYQYKGDESL